MEVLDELVLYFGAINLCYSGLLTMFRHSVFEGRGFIDTSFELILNSGLFTCSYFLARSKDRVLSIISLPVLVAFIVRSYIKYVRGVGYSIIELKGKNFIITGANSGIGFETAINIAKMGGTVVVGCRSLQRGNEARDKILQQLPNAKVHIFTSPCYRYLKS